MIEEQGYKIEEQGYKIEEQGLKIEDFRMIFSSSFIVHR